MPHRSGGRLPRARSIGVDQEPEKEEGTVGKAFIVVSLGRSK